MPAISPPPPMGMGRVSMSGASSSISSAMVPWPAITSGSLKAWTKTRSRASQISMAWMLASWKVSPSITTSAPNARVCSTFTVGVPRGMTITDGMPRREAW